MRSYLAGYSALGMFWSSPKYVADFRFILPHLIDVWSLTASDVPSRGEVVEFMWGDVTTSGYLSVGVLK